MEVRWFLPINQAVEELFACAALGDEHKVAWCDIGFMEGHNLVMMQGLEDFILLQDTLLALRLIWNNLRHKEIACGIFSALSDDTKTTSKGKKQNSYICPH